MLSKIFAVSNIGPYLVFKLRDQQKWGITKDKFALNEASKQMIGKIKDLYYNLSFEVNAEIALAEEKVQHAEKGTQQAQETGAAQAVIENTEASTDMARRQLEVKRNKWEKEKNLICVFARLVQDLSTEMSPVP
ncbi:hypothetical protein LA080_006522 [Diaporthe eres]|uniref:Uncharacterized protein n=1 Tax=Diaporthe vaccinii TaxID=105482 RepID=A0ABR4DSN6_9PEZI|nr:hypothetical protein LA080_006522 [Diaporthe eres]